ncbi:MAG: DUF58 domain-containing protein [Thermoanaerobaculia bacterium]
MARRTVPEGIRITKVGVWYIVLTLLVAVPAANTGNNALYVVEAAMLAVMVVSGFLSRGNLRGLDVAFDPPGELYAGEPAALAFRLRTRGRWIGRRLLEASGPVGSGAALVAYLPPRQERRLSIELRPARRGRLAVPYLHLASIYPLGLFRKGLRYRVEGELLVFPAILPAAELRLTGAAAGDQQRLRRVGRGHELFSLRGFRPGDDPRGIHWKQSARTGSLIYLEREAEEGKRLSVVLDNGVAPLSDAAAERVFEELVSRAASAAHHHLARGWEVELLLREGGVGFGRGRSHRLRILEVLALVEPVAAAVGRPPAPADPTTASLHFSMETEQAPASGDAYAAS